MTVIGSIRAAGSAGNAHATIATAMSAAGARTIVIGSWGAMSKTGDVISRTAVSAETDADADERDGESVSENPRDHACSAGRAPCGCRSHGCAD
jgi:hypothetical protein